MSVPRTRSPLGKLVLRTLITVFVAAAAHFCAAPDAQAAINWDGEGASSWWFDPANWNQDEFNYLPPAQDDDGDPDTPELRSPASDAQINIGTTVVYDPVNDPFFPNAANLTYPSDQTSAFFQITGRDYGPETLYRLYISRNTTNTNIVEIKSGDLAISSTTIVGRSGSNAEAQNLGHVIQTGGKVSFPLIALDLGNREGSGWGNGIWDYGGGILEVSLDGGNGLRLAAGGSAGAGGQGRFIMRNPDSGGYVRAFDMNVAANGGVNGGNAFSDPDGVLTGVGIVEFHYENGGTRPLQISENLIINNGLDADGFGTRSARLELHLDESPSVDGEGVPDDLGLFDVGFGELGFTPGITGTGDLGNVFSNADASDTYDEGDTISADFGGSTYNWTISYTGDITWNDPDTSMVGSISGPDSGMDVVLMGLSSVVNLLKGDMNGDGMLNFGDLSPFALGLTNVPAYEAMYPDVDRVAAGDVNMDDQFNFGDLSPFASLLTSGASGASAVPEPVSLGLAMAALIGLCGVRVPVWRRA